MFALSLLLVSALPARSACNHPSTLPDDGAVYSYVCVDQEIGEALRFFALNLGIAADIAPGLEGRVGAGTPDDLPRRAYLDRLAAEFRFVWYFDGSILHVAPTSSVQTEVFSLQNNNGARVISALSRVGLYQPKFRHGYDLKGKILIVSGPPAYVSDVKKTVDALEKASRTPVTVLRGSSDTPILHSVPGASSPASSGAQLSGTL